MTKRGPVSDKLLAGPRFDLCPEEISFLEVLLNVLSTIRDD